VQCSMALADVYRALGRPRDATRILESAIAFQTDDGRLAVERDEFMLNEVCADLDFLWSQEYLPHAPGPDDDCSRAIAFLESKRQLGTGFTAVQFPMLLTNLACLHHNDGDRVKAAEFADAALRAHVPAEPGSHRWNEYSKVRRRAEDVLSSDVFAKLASESRAQRAASSSCFVATACYGDPWHPDVCTFREWRDQVLARTSVGRFAIRCYHACSPILARRLEKRPRLASVVRSACLARIAVVVRRHLDEASTPPVE
jgi:hypothetical protein